MLLDSFKDLIASVFNVLTALSAFPAITDDELAVCPFSLKGE